MRKALVALIAAIFLLVGCATLVPGDAAIDPAGAVAVQSSSTPSMSSGGGGKTAGTGSKSESETSSTSSSSSSSSSSRSTTSSTSSTETSTETTETEPTEIVPPPTSGELSTAANGDVSFGGYQYYDFDDGLFLRWADASEYECSADQTTGCWGVVVFSTTGCVGGVSITLTISDEDDNTIGTVSGSSAGIALNNQVLAIIGDNTGYQGDPLAHVEVVTCLAH